MRLLSPRLNSDLAALLNGFLFGLPKLCGSPIRVSVLPQLTAFRGRLLSGSPGRGTAVHAASFIRCRRIVLESRLLRYRRAFRLILLHEIFHFIWARLGSRKRAEFSNLLEHEFAARVKGELGESAQVRKAARPTPGTLAWRDYICESFCDTAACLYSGFHRHATFTLASRWAAHRFCWFNGTFTDGCRC